MRLKYIGTSPLMTILIPIGSKRSTKIDQITLTPGKEFDLEDSEGQKLLELNTQIEHGKARIFNFAKISSESKAEEKKEVDFEEKAESSEEDSEYSDKKLKSPKKR